jgi:hypothetical protein
MRYGRTLAASSSPSLVLYFLLQVCFTSARLFTLVSNLSSCFHRKSTCFLTSLYSCLDQASGCGRDTHASLSKNLDSASLQRFSKSLCIFVTAFKREIKLSWNTAKLVNGLVSDFYPVRVISVPPKRQRTYHTAVFSTPRILSRY